VGTDARSIVILARLLRVLAHTAPQSVAIGGGEGASMRRSCLKMERGNSLAH
jgi:spermidine synthase